jgi:hypothetical protein
LFGWLIFFASSLPSQGEERQTGRRYYSLPKKRCLAVSLTGIAGPTPRS